MNLATKYSSVFTLINLIEFSYCDSLCLYYPNYPIDQSFQTSSCSYGCCGSAFPSKASEACCSSPNNTWLAYPIVFISLLVTGSIIYAFCCTKLKPSINSRFKKINPSLVNRPAAEQSVSQETSSVYSINTNQNDSSWRISSAPPKYEDVFRQQYENNVVNVLDSSGEVLPVLPGSYVPFNDSNKK